MWSMHQQETSLMGHAILEAGMPPFFELGQKPEIWGIPPMEQSQEASGLGQKTEIWGIPPQWSSHRKQVGWSKNLKYGKIPQ